MRSANLMTTSSALLALVLTESGCAPPDLGAPRAVDWPMYRGDLAGNG